MTKKLKYKVMGHLFDEEISVKIKNNYTNKLEKFSIFELAKNKKIIKALLPEDAFLIGYLLCEATVSLPLADNS